MKLTKKEKDYLLFNLKDGQLDDLKKDLRRWSNRNIDIEKEIKSEIKILTSIVNKIEKGKNDKL
jgi:predicted nucleotide-binding protein (sugar kinase/HSP70/actin superfamily)|tara:strand:- start:8 stop:199 length:192 start_codon:yes stop_codon:yes gene_type:complete